MKEIYESKAKLLFTDTDNLTYESEINDVYEDLYSDKDLFEFSEYSENFKFYDKTNIK